MTIGKDNSGVLYAVKRAGSAVAYCSLSVRGGTRYEAGFHSGIAHFTEHTVFKGTEHKSARIIGSYIDRLGGELNAYTTKEEIVLHATVLKEDISKACGILMELATMASFPDKEIETEKGVVTDEIQSCKDCLADYIYDKFEERLFQGHPLAMPILGTRTSVRQISSQELRKFASEKFAPTGTAFCIVADIDEKKVEQMLLRMLSRYYDSPGKTVNISDSTAKVPHNVFCDTIARKSHETNVIIGGYAPSLYEEKERMAAILLCNILGGPGSNSILNRILREKNGWVYGVESSYTQYSDTGIMAISLGCERENMDKCIATVEREIQKMQQDRLSDRALKASRKQLLGQLAIASDNGESQCLGMGKSLLAFGRIPSRDEDRSKIEAVSAEEIQDMAQRVFAPQSTSRIVMA